MYIDDNDVVVSSLGSFLVIVFMIFPVSVIIRAEYLSIKYEKGKTCIMQWWTIIAG